MYRYRYRKTQGTIAVGRLREGLGDCHANISELKAACIIGRPKRLGRFIGDCDANSELIAAGRLKTLEGLGDYHTNISELIAIGRLIRLGRHMQTQVSLQV